MLPPFGNQGVVPQDGEMRVQFDPNGSGAMMKRDGQMMPPPQGGSGMMNGMKKPPMNGSGSK